MRVFIVTNHFLDGNGGGPYASRAVINGFAEFAEECLLLYPESREKIDSYINPKVAVKGILSKKKSIEKLIDIYFGRINRFAGIFKQELIKFKPEVVVFDNSRASAGLIQIAKSAGCKIITVHHNYEVEYYRGTPPPKLWRYPLLHYMKKAEKKSVILSDLNLTLTEQDIDLLRKNYDPLNEKNFECLGIFEYKKSSDFSAPEAVERKNNELCFVITGSLSSYQTEVSLLPFFEHYYPIVKKCFPRAKLIVAGKDPSESIKSLCNKNADVLLVANPANMPEIIKQCDIYICPVAVGGGLKLRIMDGLKMGLPVLSHSVSARGYDDFQREGVLFKYDNEPSFENGLKKVAFLLRDAKLREKVIEQYRKIFSFEGGTQRLFAILKRTNFY
ncbi:MAG: glycosyltransferase family 4 protein [Chitinophagaceae bacterium]|nr:glycosyltransferase family 4 protein [Chitinophagaceae bacterium]